MTRPQRPDGANRAERYRPPLVSNVRPQPEVTAWLPELGREEPEASPPRMPAPLDFGDWQRAQAAEPSRPLWMLPFDALFVGVGLWWLFGPLIVFLLLVFGVVDGRTVEGWWL